MQPAYEDVTGEFGFQFKKIQQT